MIDGLRGPEVSLTPQRALTMQIARLKAFKSELEAEVRNHPTLTGFLLLLKTPSGWNDDASVEITDAQLAADAEKHLRDGRVARRSRTQFLYPIQSLQAVALTNFASAPRKSTRDDVAKRIKQTLKRSDDAFDARHDSLTGLRNKRAFDEDLRQALKSLANLPATPGTIIQALSSVTVLATDLDHFKQVNDTYGHLYGDVVLRVFAMRMTQLVATLEADFAGRATISAARIGGEEFAVTIVGDLSAAEVDAVSERLRLAITNTPLPSDEEWSELEPVHTNSIPLPPLVERNVTISIGVSAAATSPTDPAAIASELKQQADTALYRAKAGGRNTSRRYSDILTKHGTILEHHGDTGIVAIDIGRQVKVAVGHEFLVFHPDFTGNRSFIHSDGRSKKRLGGYPRYPCGRIVVFDVQPEISFCKIVEQNLTGPFPVGSALEAVPLGAITHLISGTAALGVGIPLLAPIDHLAQEIRDAASAKRTDICAMVLGLSNLDQLAAERGVAFVNRALAAIYNHLREATPPGTTIAQLQSSQFAAFLHGPAATRAQQIATGCVTAASSDTAGIAKYRAGFAAYLGNNKAKKDAASATTLPREHLLELARYAAAPTSGPNAVVEFTPDVADTILSDHYANARHREAVADYLRFRDMGIAHRNIDNTGALSAYSLGQFDLSLQAIGRAMQLDPESDVIRANAGYIQFHVGDRLTAADTFRGLTSLDGLNDVYYGPIALAFYAAFKRSPAFAAKSEVERFLGEAIRRKGVAQSLKLECATALSDLVRLDAEAATGR